ncbi:hypothetical protein RIF25_04720 [Thermosynechococcaceae cyanobacterium BACA0444]|uniref:Uncharacterized protein n=1 Tax=Pseudocalidococcus azoricus BACA0444 TaxID=2918990 RepID=A0AAE4FPY9_9CYAN|nr:hypothetical protein [Pseudocalidococcus azoricus]MDS3860104.1 hypothetical protein [Pseudocalidococcus azoricus BACA0444]
MTIVARFMLTIGTVTGAVLMMASAEALIPSPRKSLGSNQPWLAYSVVDDAYQTCSKELARYGVRVTGLVDSYSGKGGATVVLRGVNAGGYPVTAECNLTIPSRALDIRYL